MKINTIELPKSTYISDIEPFKSHGIPTNSIVHKEITGCGITTYEIRFAKHHSIIILPNVPVIKGKVSEHNRDYPDAKILAVYKGVDIDDIEDYLNTDVEHKKILTTPEGFVTKVIKAFDSNLQEMLTNWFLLYDECERIITDVSYRGKIAAPLDIFHQFDNKALVSATTLNFSDSRFEGFERYSIVPQFEYSKPLTVINTNNVLTSIKNHVAQLQSDKVCIFFNSTNGIFALTKALEISKESKAYCSRESVKKLLEKGFGNATEEFDSNEMVPYSFFTSRYFSAVDIKMDEQPDVILVTDVIYADHSILDPHTEVIQIAGRFRNGINSLTHITNFNSRMEVRTQEEELVYLEGCLDTYEDIVQLLNRATHPGSKETLEFFVNESPIANFFSNGKRNPFMIDNDLNAERVKGYFTSKENLKLAYDKISNHFTTVYINEEHLVADEDEFVLANLQTKKERHKYVTNLLERYALRTNRYRFLSEAERSHKDNLIKRYPLIDKAYNLLGLTIMEATGYGTEKIKKAMRTASKQNEIHRLEPFIKSTFLANTSYEESFVKAKLLQIYADQGSVMKVSATHILRYFYGKRSTKNKLNVYQLEDRMEISSIQKQ